jgi:hypothetical protein
MRHERRRRCRVLAGGSRSITVSKTSDAGDCDAIPNTVTVAATNEPGNATGNDTSQATIVVNCPDLTVEISGEPGQKTRE